MTPSITRTGMRRTTFIEAFTPPRERRLRSA